MEELLEFISRDYGIHKALLANFIATSYSEVLKKEIYITHLEDGKMLFVDARHHGILNNKALSKKDIHKISLQLHDKCKSYLNKQSVGEKIDLAVMNNWRLPAVFKHFDGDKALFFIPRIGLYTSIFRNEFSILKNQLTIDEPITLYINKIYIDTNSNSIKCDCGFKSIKNIKHIIKSVLFDIDFTVAGFGTDTVFIRLNKQPNKIFITTIQKATNLRIKFIWRKKHVNKAI